MAFLLLCCSKNVFSINVVSLILGGSGTQSGLHIALMTTPGIYTVSIQVNGAPGDGTAIVFSSTTKITQIVFAHTLFFRSKEIEGDWEAWRIMAQPS